MSFALIVTAICSIGMGDFKLFTVMVLTQGECVLSADYFRWASIFIAGSLLIHVLVFRSFRGAIPFAPVLTVPLALIYLGI